MTGPVEQDCPVCDGSQTAREQFATAKVAEHIKEKARHDERHRAWIETHTESGTIAEIRAALTQRPSPSE